MTTSRHKQVLSKADWVYAALLTILAAVPRLYQLGLAEFKLDEATHYQLAYQLTHGNWQWVGSTSSVGIPKPPLFVYALAIPMQLSRDPRVITGFIGVLAALATGGFYLILRRFLGKGAAISGALLFALNPQAILYARKLFTADLLPPLCTLFLATAIAFLESSPRHSSRWAILSAFTFGLLLLNTFSPVVLLPALVFLFWQRRQYLNTSDWIKSALTIVILFIPYGVQIADQLPHLLPQAFQTSNTSDCPPVITWTWNLLYGRGLPEKWGTMEGAATVILALLSIGGLLWLITATRNPGNRNRSAVIFMLTWIFSAPLLAAILPIEAQAHYLVVLYPLLFILPAGGIEIASNRSKWLGGLAISILLITAGWQASNWFSMLDDVAAGIEGYGTPLGYWWKAASQAKELLHQQNAAEVVLVMPGDNAWDEKAHIFDALLSDTPHRVVDGHQTTLYPPHMTIIMIASEVEEALSLLTPCTRSLHPSIKASPFGGTYHYRLWDGRLLKENPSASACQLNLQPASTRWASGAYLLGYQITGSRQPGGTLHILLHWGTDASGLGQEVHWFNHLIDPEEQTWGQFDPTAWPSTRWHSGDFFHAMTYFDIEISSDAPEAPYTLRVGQYTYPEMQNIPVIDEAGNPLAYAEEFAIAIPESTR